MKVVTKEMYETSDGTVFDDQLEAQEHEHMLKVDPLIVEYLARDNIDNDRTKTKMTNAIKAWEMFRVSKQPVLAEVKTA